MEQRNWFVKSHALGNDYLVLDPGALTFPLTEQRIRLICDRHQGVGSDGILALQPSRRADFGVRIFNPDGSEAEKSGNGLRIFSRFLYEHGRTSKPQFTIETLGGVVGVVLELEGGTLRGITVEIGTATFRSEQIPMAGPSRDVVGEEIRVDGQSVRITAVSVGNPHCVVFVPDLEQVDFYWLGPRLERHALFPNRTNVQFAKVETRRRIRARIWERGAGETLASGSSACAVAAAALRNGLADPDLTIVMAGGELRVSVGPDWSIRLAGPAEEVCAGTFSPNFVELLERSEPSQTRPG